MAERPRRVQRSQIVFRVGINLGDVIVDERRYVHGDGVNVAARWRRWPSREQS